MSSGRHRSGCPRSRIDRCWHPLSRPGEPVETANAAVLLASGLCSFTTGSAVGAIHV
jgi:hypothetical protein